MPELPDIVVYVKAITRRVQGRRMRRVKVASPFLLRTFKPPVESIEGRRVVEVRGIGKRVAIGCEDDDWLVIHRRIAGRLHWSDKSETPRSRTALAKIEFDNRTLILTEAGSKQRPSLPVIGGAARLSLQGAAFFSARLLAFVSVLIVPLARAIVVRRT